MMDSRTTVGWRSTMFITVPIGISLFKINEQVEFPSKSAQSYRTCVFSVCSSSFHAKCINDPLTTNANGFSLPDAYPMFFSNMGVSAVRFSFRSTLSAQPKVKE